METNSLQRSSSRSRRSNTNLSNLRLAPLSNDFSDISSSVDMDSSIQSSHTSYIQGKSAPTTPGILGRTSSRRQLGGGLSRKLSLYATDAPHYAAVEVTGDGTPRNALRPEPDTAMMPKAKSEAALLNSRPPVVPMIHTQWGHHQNGSNRHHKRSQTGGHLRVTEGEDWLTRAGLATSSLLRESKGQSWLVSRDSSTSLVDQTSDIEEDEDARARMSFSSHHRLHFADDELSPETPRINSRWGSRFGSRAPSAKNSRRGSRADLQKLPSFNNQKDGYFDGILASSDLPIEPDFVDVDEPLNGEEDAETEVARLARERSFGFGGLIDKLVGWSLFSVDEDRETTDVEQGTHRGDQRRDMSEQPQLRITRDDPIRSDGHVPALYPQPNAQDEGGWQDAAWLLSVASRVLL